MGRNELVKEIYIAKITSRNEAYKFLRTWLSWKVQSYDFETGDVIELRCTFNNGFRHRHYFVVNQKGVFQYIYSTIIRFRKDMELEQRVSTIKLPIEEVKELYYIEELPKTTIAQHFGMPIRKLERFFEEQEWEPRIISSLVEIRDEKFGKYCVSCGELKEQVHRKDGIPHTRSATWTKKALRAINTDEWVALCRSCHQLSHSLMTSFGCNWDDIEVIVNEIAKKYKR